MFRMILAVSALLAATVHAQFVTVMMPASQDNTLYESVIGNLSNGAGDYLFAGETGAGGAPTGRRALVQFDVAGNVPAGSIVVGATLRMEVLNPNGAPGSVTLTLHPVLGGWGEAGSDAPSGEGGGDTAQNGDVTWLHREFPNVFWNAPGGDFGPVSDSLVNMGNGGIAFTGSGLLADVQSWLDDPCHNFGWLIDGNGGLARRFESRENASGNGPQLSVVYLAGSVTPKFPGNGPDLFIDVGINGCASGNGSGTHNVVTSLNDIVSLNFNSPGNTYTGQGFFASLQPFATGATTGDVGGPAPLPLGGGTLVHLDLGNAASILPIVNSLNPGGLFTQVISPGVDINFVVPAVFSGMSFVTVCLIPDFAIPGDLIAVADAQELVIL